MIEVYFWLTDNGYKSLIAIEESGLPHKKHPVNLQKREQFSPEFLKISPGHKIPALVDDDGPGGQRITLCESGAILKYLAEKAGKLYPSDPAKRARVDQWFFYGTSTFTPLAQQYGLFMHRFGEDVPPAKKHYDGVLRDMFQMFDRHLAANDYMAGSEYTIADISCYPDVHVHGKEGIGLDAYPNLNRWHDRIAARPAVQRAYAVKV
jgi:GSH-dependent disulfide-bond oxidoreductase